MARRDRTRDDHSDPGLRPPPFVLNDEKLSDTALAELIQDDAARLHDSGFTVDLARYLDAIDDMGAHPIALDTAIDAVLRARSRGGEASVAIIEQLCKQHASIAAAIRDAAALSNALWSTEAMLLQARTDAPQLPMAFGPPLQDKDALRYELLELLGRGASSDVYLALDRHLSDDDERAFVAIKVLARDPLGERAVEEARLLRRIEHPAVLRVIDAGSDDNLGPYICLEYAANGPLSLLDLAHLRSDRGRPAALFIARVCDGVHAAHLAGLVHRDLKPANILLTVALEPKVADFGIAARVDSSPSDAGAGTRAFMAPEQLEHDALVGLSADVFALAGIALWTLSGVAPNIDREVPAVKCAQTALVGADDDLSRIIRRGLAAGPLDRHSSAAELADDLRAWASHRPIGWMRPTLFKRTRLLALRAPVATTLAAVATIAIVIGGAASLILAERARANALERLVAEARFEAEKEWRGQTAKAIELVSANLRKTQEAGLSAEMLTTIWLLEWVYGGGMLADPTSLDRLWGKRLELLRGTHDRLTAAGQSDSIESMLVGTGMALWLVRRGESQEAIDVVAELRSAWEDRLHPDDAWLSVLALFDEAAYAQLSLASTDAGRAESLRTHARALDSIYQQLGGTADSGTLRAMTVEVLIEIWSEGGLNDPEESARWRSVYDSIPVSGKRAIENVK